MSTKAELVRLGVRGPGSVLPSYDYEAPDYATLATILGDDTTYPKTNKTLWVSGDCAGAAITITSKSWPGFTIRGTSSSVRPVMPRLVLNGLAGSDGSPVLFKWLDFYNVYTGPGPVKPDPAVSEAQILFQTGGNTYITFDACKFHDDPWSGKSFLTTYPNVYRSFNCPAPSDSCNHLTIKNCEIYNAIRAFLRGDHVLTENNDWHDHYNHAATITGNNHTHRDSRCWNLWANQTDYDNPHAGVGFSPSPTGTSDMTDCLIEGIVAIPGTARFEYDGKNPGGSGFKFNDMKSTGFRYRRCTVRGNLIVGTDAFMIEMDAGTDCTIEFNTVVHDEAQTATTPGILVNDGDNVTVRHNIMGSLNIGADGRGTNVKPFANALALPNDTPGDSLVSYANLFTGASFSSFTSTAAALAAFALDATHPAYSWPVKPGAVDNYDFDTGTLTGVAADAPVSSNVTSQTLSTVAKTADVYLRTPTAPTGTGAWMPANRRQATIILSMKPDSTIDAATKYAFFASSNSRGYIQRLSTGKWRLNMNDSAGALIVSATSTVSTVTADGLRTLAVALDLEAGKIVMAFDNASGAALLDVPTVTVLRNADWDVITSRVLTIGNDNTTGTTNSWVGDQDTVFFEDQFVDLWTDAGLGAVFNSSGGLADLGAGGTNVFGSTAALYLHANAATLNAGNYNDGDGLGGTGGATATKFNKGGAGSFT